MKSPKEIAEEKAKFFTALRVSLPDDVAEDAIKRVESFIQHERDEAEKKLDRIREAMVKKGKETYLIIGTRPIDYKRGYSTGLDDAIDVFDSARNEK